MEVGESLDVDTPSGTARLWLGDPGEQGVLVLGHGAGGGIDAPDLSCVATVAATGGWQVAMVEQPYRVKGRRAPEAAPRLDAAWLAVVTELRRRSPGARLVCGGRSSGARVACRTALAAAADAVLALAFPLHPPGRTERSRLPELTAAGVPVLVVQGERDPFGGPAEFPAGTRVAAVPGDHSLRQAVPVLPGVVGPWLAGIGGAAGVLHRP